MRRACIVLAALAIAASALVMGSTNALGAGKRKIRWVQSIYVDAKGNGLKHPEGVACRGDQLVVADTGNSRILRYSFSSDSVSANAEFALPKSYPIKVRVNSKGDIYFLDGKERRIEKMNATGEERGVMKPTNLPSSKEIAPKSFTIGSNDDIYILDIFSARVLVLDSEGQYQRHVAFPDEYGFFSDLAVDARGSIYLVDGVEVVVYTAEKGADRFTPLTESLDSYMNFPTNISIGDDGVIYLVDQYGSGLALVGRDGSFLGRMLGLGWNEFGLYYPSQICISPKGDLFIADRNNSRVQRFSLGAGGSAKRRGEEAPAE